jgi:hypothetical protein
MMCMMHVEKPGTLIPCLRSATVCLLSWLLRGTLPSFMVWEVYKGDLFLFLLLIHLSTFFLFPPRYRSGSH